MRIVLMGPPGAGKGTQATIVAARLGVPHISSGELFRSQIAAETPLGAEARLFIDRGEYVPDDITNGMIRDRLAQPDARNGFLLDGYPRTIDQIHRLDEMLAATGDAIDKVIELVVDTDVVVERLRTRASREGRSDDSEEVIRNRFVVYDRQTAPLTHLYEGRGRLRRVDALGTIDEVTERLLAAIND